MESSLIATLIRISLSGQGNVVYISVLNIQEWRFFFSKADIVNFDVISSKYFLEVELVTGRLIASKFNDVNDKSNHDFFFRGGFCPYLIPHYRDYIYCFLSSAITGEFF